MAVAVPTAQAEGPVPELPGTLGVADAALMTTNMVWTIPLAGSSVRTLSFTSDGGPVAMTGSGMAEQTGRPATDFTWIVESDGRLCLTPAPSGMAPCVYLRRTETALLLLDPTGNLQGEIATLLVE